MKSMNVKKMTTLGILSAMAIIINLLISFPMVPAVSFLRYDPKDIIIVIGGFIYGPFAAFLMSGICAVLEIIFRGGTILDIVMNMIATCSFACIASAIYKRDHTKKGAIIGLCFGIVAVTISMLIWNYIVTPIYFNMPREAVVQILLPGILPFNLLKSGLNAVVTMLLYKPLVQILRRTNLIEKSGHAQRLSAGYIIVGVFVLVTIVMVILILQGII
ncbi:MAG: ECF transporter S component [Coprobacillus sp.]